MHWHEANSVNALLGIGYLKPHMLVSRDCVRRRIDRQPAVWIASQRNSGFEQPATDAAALMRRANKEHGYMVVASKRTAVSMDGTWRPPSVNRIREPSRLRGDMVPYQARLAAP